MAGLATADLAAMEDRLTLRMSLTATELRSEMAGLSGRIDRLEGRIDGFEGKLDGFEGKLVGFGGHLDGEIDNLRSEMATQNRILLFATVTAIVGLSSLVLGVAGVIFTVVSLLE